jgi:cytochrome c-type biogenesis protein CcmH
VPPLVLAGGGLAMWIQSRRRSRSAAGDDPSLFKLTADEETRLQQLIAAEPSSDQPG